MSEKKIPKGGKPQETGAGGDGKPPSRYSEVAGKIHYPPLNITRHWKPPYLKPGKKSPPKYEAPKPPLKHWVPPEERKKPAPPPKYEAPKPTTRKWVSPELKPKKSKPKTVYEPPPLSPPKKKWVPPEQRKKKPPTPPKFTPPPPGKGLKVPHSTLKKTWGNFIFYNGVNNMGFLRGNHSQLHNRYHLIAGKQGAGTTVMACTMIKIQTNPAIWDKDVVDEIILYGKLLYEGAKKKVACSDIKVEDIVKNFIYKKKNIIIEIDTLARVTQKINNCLAKNILTATIKNFFNNHEAGVLKMLEKYVAIWKLQEQSKNKSLLGYYIFDPDDHDKEGKWMTTKPEGNGYGIVGKTYSKSVLAEYILSIFPKFTNIEAEVTPVRVMKIGDLVLKPPETFEDLAKADKQEKVVCKLKKSDTNVTEKPPPEEADLGKVLEVSLKADEVKEKPAFLSSLPVAKVKEKIDAKPQKPSEALALGDVKQRLPTKYKDIIPGKMGILRGKSCQENPSFSKYKGKQSLGNGVAAITMLRLYQSKKWTSKLIHDIMQYGEYYYSFAMKNKSYGYTLKLDDFPKTYEMDKKKFNLVVDEFAALGQLNSREVEILDLEMVLENYFAMNSAGIVIGPIILAVWVEEGFYYMFDPNERDELGRAFSKPEGQYPTERNIQGVACVTRYNNIADLVEVYKGNVPLALKYSYFHMSMVKVNDDPKMAAKWYNFNPMVNNRWILRATFSQNDGRFDHPGRGIQCTAMASMSLYYAKLNPNYKDWSSETLNQILTAGDKYYRDSLGALRESNPEFAHVLLCGDEVLKKYRLGDKEIIVKIECPIFGTVKDLPAGFTGFYDFKKGIPAFFQSNNFGLCTSGSISIAIWKHSPKEFYYFDSHPRNDKGLVQADGLACLIRTTNCEDLIKSILPNIPCTEDGQFNMFSFDITTLDVKDGVALAPALHYQNIESTVSILRSYLSTASEKYWMSREQQVLASLLVAFAYNLLFEAAKWKTKDLDKILDKGNELFTESFNAVQNNEDEEEVKVTLENITKEFILGVNKFEMKFTLIQNGSDAKNIREALKNHFSENPNEDNPHRELLLETKDYSVGIFRDMNAFYIFDPRPRDKKGHVIGKFDWDEPDKASGDFEAEKSDTDNDKDNMDETGDKADEGDEEREIKDDNYEDEAKAENKDEGYVNVPISPKKKKKSHRKHNQEFWEDMRKKYGHACSIKFLVLDQMIDHVVGNIEPKPEKLEFMMSTMEITNQPIIVNKFRPEEGEKITDPYDGDWYNFKEIERKKWILRGTRRMTDERYHVNNRGKQAIPTTVMSLCYFFLFHPRKFSDSTVDRFLDYGDRMLTLVKKARVTNLKANTSLNEKDILAIVEDTPFSIEDVLKKLKIVNIILLVNISESVSGHLKAGNLEKVLDLKRALNLFFEKNNFGLIKAKDLFVAVHKGSTVYYMFDPQNRGPAGCVDAVGVPCITRFINLDNLIDIFLSNCDPYGGEDFYIYKVDLKNITEKKGQDELEEADEQVAKKMIAASKFKETPAPQEEVKVGGWHNIKIGKQLLRGGGDYIEMVESRSPALVFVALGMSLVHQTSTWTRPVLNEINTIGSELFEESTKNLNVENFNLVDVNNNFKIGVVKVNVQLKLPEIGGVDKNLRETIDELYKYNSHGVLEISRLTFAIWEDKDIISGRNLLYLYDPLLRGTTGLPIPYNGHSCLLTFYNSKLMAEHIEDVVKGENLKLERHRLIPVEVVVGDKRSRHRKIKEKEKKSTECQIAMQKHDISQKMKVTDETLKQKEQKELSKLGRYEYHCILSGQILRGYKTLDSSVCKACQDLPCSIIACVLFKIEDIDYWNCTTLDLILDTGTQLYIDSFIAYNPKDPHLGMENIIRKFFLKDESVKITVYKPIVTQILTPTYLAQVLDQYFFDDRFSSSGYCIISYNKQYFAVFYHNNTYYLFDPHNIDHYGYPSSKGTAVLFKFQKVEDLAERFVRNYCADNPFEDISHLRTFSLFFFNIDIGFNVGKTNEGFKTYFEKSAKRKNKS